MSSRKLFLFTREESILLYGLETVVIPMMSFGYVLLQLNHWNDFYRVIYFQLLLDIFQDLGTECTSEYYDHDQTPTYHFCYSETYSFYSYRSFHRDAIILFALLSESKTCSYFHRVYFLDFQFFLERMSLSFPSYSASSNPRT